MTNAESQEDYFWWPLDRDYPALENSQSLHPTLVRGAHLKCRKRPGWGDPGLYLLKYFGKKKEFILCHSNILITPRDVDFDDVEPHRVIDVLRPE